MEFSGKLQTTIYLIRKLLSHLRFSIYHLKGTGFVEKSYYPEKKVLIHNLIQLNDVDRHLDKVQK